MSVITKFTWYWLENWLEDHKAENLVYERIHQCEQLAQHEEDLESRSWEQWCCECFYTLSMKASATELQSHDNLQREKKQDWWVLDVLHKNLPETWFACQESCKLLCFQSTRSEERHDIWI